MAAVRSALNLHRLPIERSTEGLVFASRTVAPHVVEMSDKAADFVMNELVSKYTVTEGTRLWNEMALGVERDVRIFNGLEPAPHSPEQSDDLDPLTEQELEDVGDLGEAQE